MHNFLIIKYIFLSTLLTNVLCREICYGELGCFSDAPPFSGNSARPIAVLPDKPEKIAVKFSMFTRSNRDNGVYFDYQNLPNIFNPNLKTVFVCHGFVDNIVKPWMVNIKNAILGVEEANIVLVDWTKGNGFPYTQATANTRVVGAEIARLVNSMIANRGAKAADFHLIGHSLGAHISGYAGSRINGLGRITGLDPAGPNFEFTDPVVRLDPTDALYVDAIHTDGASTLQIGAGLMQPVGHADFYPNGGKFQPECKKTSDKLLGAIFNLVSFNMDGVEDALGCNHMAAIAYFIESIGNRNCKYNAYKCSSGDEFDRGNCAVCSSKGCNQMGYWSSPSRDVGELYLNTLTPNGDSYCAQVFRVKLVSDNIYSQAKGTFKMYLKTSTHTSPVQTIDDTKVTFKPDSTEVRMFSVGETRMSGLVESAFVSYTKTGNILTTWFYDDSWSFKQIEIFSLDNQFTVKLCPTSNKIQSSFVEFKRC